jgi:transposase
MSRRQKDPLRPLSEAERASLSRLSRSQSAPAAQVARARALLAVAEGQSYTAAAQLVGREVGDTVARWVAGFNRDGLAALVPHHGGGHRVRYGEAEQRRILAEVARTPERARDGTATWSLTALREALRRAEDGLPGISTYTICTAPGCLDNGLPYAARLKVSSCQAARISAGLRYPFFSTSHSAL